MTARLRLLLLPFLLAGCQTPHSRDLRDPDAPPRVWTTSFESVDDFQGFFIENASNWDSAQELAGTGAYEGLSYHRAWVTGPRDAHNDGTEYRPHRAYPTLQFQKTPEGTFPTPCLVTLWVWADMVLVDRPAGAIDDWLSLATLSPDATDLWARTVLVNLTPDGYLKLVHVPTQGQQERTFQVDAASDPGGDLRFPHKTWTRLDIYLDLDASKGQARVWQNGEPVSAARVQGGSGRLAQAHFGLYASAAVAEGEVGNDALRVLQMADLDEAERRVRSETQQP